MDIDPHHLAIVQAILNKNLPSQAQIFVFGSRSRGDAKPYSDLDLAIDLAGETVSLSILAALADDFDESDLPYKVDIVDWNTIDKSFQSHIQKNLLPLRNLIQGEFSPHSN
jgi:type I restriction enzyme S subunit